MKFFGSILLTIAMTMLNVLEPWIYKDTFTGTIRFGKLDTTFEEVVDAATTARAFIGS